MRARFFVLSMLLPILVAACGGGGGSSPPAGPAPAVLEFRADKAHYAVGESARLTVAWRGSTGRIEPGIGAVANGATVTTRALDATITYRLVVEDGGRRVERALTLPVDFRGRYVELPPFTAAEHATVTAGDGSILVFGGSRGLSAVSESIDRFDAATGRFVRIGSMRTGRAGHTATRLPDGRVLVLGGATSLQIGNVADVIDERTGAVSHGGDLVAPRFWHATTLLADGRVLVTGGHGRNSLEIWDPATNTWRLVAARLATPRSRHTATLLADGRVLIAGGFADGMPSYRFAEIFDPVSETLTPVEADVNEPRRFHAAHRLADGSVLLAGGEIETAAGAVPVASVLRFDPASGRVVATAPLASARTVVQSVLLPDGRVVMLGGERDVDLPTEGGEVYGTDRGGALLPPMPAARAWHTADRLPDGRILIVGGMGPGGAYVPQTLVLD